MGQAPQPLKGQGLYRVCVCVCVCVSVSVFVFAFVFACASLLLGSYLNLLDCEFQLKQHSGTSLAELC